MDSQSTNRSCEKKNFLSRTEFAAESGLSTATVDRYLRDGRIRKYQPGGAGCRVLIPRSEFKRIDPASEDSGTWKCRQAANLNPPWKRGAVPKWKKVTIN